MEPPAPGFAIRIKFSRTPDALALVQDAIQTELAKIRDERWEAARKRRERLLQHLKACQMRHALLVIEEIMTVTRQDVLKQCLGHLLSNTPVQAIPLLNDFLGAARVTAVLHM